MLTTTDHQDELLEIFILWEAGSKLDAVKKYKLLMNIQDITIAYGSLQKVYNNFNKKGNFEF